MLLELNHGAPLPSMDVVSSHSQKGRTRVEFRDWNMLSFRCLNERGEFLTSWRCVFPRGQTAGNPPHKWAGLCLKFTGKRRGTSRAASHFLLKRAAAMSSCYVIRPCFQTVNLWKVCVWIMGGSVLRGVFISGACKDWVSCSSLLQNRDDAVLMACPVAITNISIWRSFQIFPETSSSSAENAVLSDS